MKRTLYRTLFGLALLALSCSPKGDITGDRKVDASDLGTVMSRWGRPAAKEEDPDRSGTIDQKDVEIIRKDIRKRR